ncbi:MAG: DinB family protein [Roseivirga sp.]|nr:DinB family protein [Roseivirga sp.]
MNSIDLILLNFEEIRRRSIKLWSGIATENYDWKPDEKALSVLEMMRHVLETEHLYHVIIQNRGNLGDYASPWEGRPYKGLEEELEFAASYRADFINMVRSFSAEDLESIVINRTEVNQKRKLGDYLMRMAYHESVHTGQMLDYLRTMGAERPLVWD